jgi:hypothetical protein
MPLPHESLVSFLERLRVLNHYDTAEWICSYRYPNILSSADDYRSLTRMTGLSIEDIFHLTLHRFAPSIMSPDELQRVQEVRIADAGMHLPAPWLPDAELEQYMRTPNRIVVCPQCWQEHQAILLPNSLRFITTCPWHQSVLVDRCPCGNRLMLPLKHGCCTACGTTFGALPTYSIDDHRPSLQMTALLWSAIGCSSESFPPASLGLPADHPLHDMHPSELFRFLWKFCRAIRGLDLHHDLFDRSRNVFGGHVEAPPSRMESASVNFLHTILVTLTDLLMNWPTGWSQLFAGIAESELQLGRYVESVLPLQLIEHFPIARWRWLYETWLTTVRETFGFNTAVSSWLPYCDAIQRRVSGSTPTPMFRRWNHHEPVEQQHRNQRHLLDLSQAATYLGVDEQQVVIMVAAGIIEALHGPLFDTSLVWVFDRDDLHRFLESLLASIPMNVDTYPEERDRSGIVTMTHVWQMLVDADISFARLVIDVQLGHLAAMRCDDALSFQSLVFEHRPIMDYIATYHGTPYCIALPIDSARIQLRCSYHMLRCWYSTGVLIPAWENIGFHDVFWFYYEEDVERVASYLTSEEAAQFLGVSIATLRRWIRADQIPAIKNSISMERGNPAMFDQEELAAWRYARLTREEAARLLGLSFRDMNNWVRDKKIVPMEVMENRRQWFSRQAVEELAQELQATLAARKIVSSKNSIEE